MLAQKKISQETCAEDWFQYCQNCGQNSEDLHYFVLSLFYKYVPLREVSELDQSDLHIQHHHTLYSEACRGHFHSIWGTESFNLDKVRKLFLVLQNCVVTKLISNFFNSKLTFQYSGILRELENSLVKKWPNLEFLHWYSEMEHDTRLAYTHVSWLDLFKRTYWLMGRVFERKAANCIRIGDNLHVRKSKNLLIFSTRNEISRAVPTRNSCKKTTVY